MVRQFFIPTFLGVILFLWLVIVQATVFRTTAMTTSSVRGDWMCTQLTFGYPTVLEIRPGDHPAVTVYWKNVLMVFTAAYALTIPLGRWITGYRAGGEVMGPVHSGLRSPAAIVLIVFAACALLGVSVSVLLRSLSAGMQDVPWQEMWWGLTLMGMILATPITLIVMAVRRIRRRRSIAARGLAVEMVA